MVLCIYMSWYLLRFFGFIFLTGFLWIVDYVAHSWAINSAYGAVESQIPFIAFLATLLFFIYSLYKIRTAVERKRAKLGLVILWGFLVFAQIEYVPSMQIQIVDFSGKPVQGIPLSSTDSLGNLIIPLPLSLLCFERCPQGTLTRYLPDIYVTDLSGKIKTKGRVHFGLDHTKKVTLNINYDESVLMMEHFAKDPYETNTSETLPVPSSKPLIVLGAVDHPRLPMAGALVASSNINYKSITLQAENSIFSNVQKVILPSF